MLDAEYLMLDIGQCSLITIFRMLDAAKCSGMGCKSALIRHSVGGKGINELGVGEMLQAVTSDPGALSDFPAWVKTSGNEIPKTATEDNETSFYVKRLA